MLSQEQIDFYHTNGYLGVEDVLSGEEVEELRRVTDAFVEASRQVTETDKVFDLEPGHTPESPQLRRLIDPSRQHDVYARGLRHERILDIIAQLIGPGIRTNGDKLNMKSAEVGQPGGVAPGLGVLPPYQRRPARGRRRHRRYDPRERLPACRSGVSQGAHTRPPPQRPFCRRGYRAGLHR